MYEEATILDFEGKKIWVKNIAQSLYCVNGRYILFAKQQDLENVVTFAFALDEFHNPTRDLKQALSSDAMIMHTVNLKRVITITLRDLSCCLFDTSGAGAISKEYREWADSIGSDDIYVYDADSGVGPWCDRYYNRYVKYFGAVKPQSGISLE